MSSDKSTQQSTIAAAHFPPPLPYEFVHLHRWFSMAQASVRQGHTWITTQQPQSPEGAALRALYAACLRTCLDVLDALAPQHLPDELAACVAAQYAALADDLETLDRRTARRQQAASRAAVAVTAVDPVA
jgi:hypothetical protein